MFNLSFMHMFLLYVLKLFKNIYPYEYFVSLLEDFKLL